MEVLVVEDSPGDVRLMREAFRGVNELIQFRVAVDGVEAMAYLRREGAYVDAARPDLILLDLNMPRMDGREVLACLKADPDLRLIPTIVLTTSDAADDIATSYRLQANCYLKKPMQLDEFDALVKSINDLWLIRARLPRRGPAIK